jgi:uncharacterized membrane protein YfcA
MLGLLATVTPHLPATQVASGLLALSLLFGAVVGFSLGLTGGGGSIFAVPLLMYGLGIPSKEAMGVSLAAVGATALLGMLPRLRSGEVELTTGLLFAAAGMLGAPFGTYLRSVMPEPLLLGLFVAVMLVVAARMWLKATRTAAEARALAEPVPADDRGPTCRRDPEGRLRLTSGCVRLLALVGLATGVLSGLFGVGGGFVVVPALVLFSGMGIHRAVATSLLVIALIGAAGVVAHIASGHTMPLAVTVWFISGGLAGMLAGIALGRRISGPRLQQLFALAIVAVAAYVVLRSLTA